MPSENPSEELSKPIFPTSIQWPESQQVIGLMRQSLPVIFSYILDTTVPLISFYFLDDDLLIAAAGLGKMWMSCFSSAVYFSIAAGFEVLVSQAHGIKDYRSCSVYI